jgi:hypothetical protein
MGGATEERPEARIARCQGLRFGGSALRFLGCDDRASRGEEQPGIQVALLFYHEPRFEGSRARLPASPRLAGITRVGVEES